MLRQTGSSGRMSGRSPHGSASPGRARMAVRLRAEPAWQCVSGRSPHGSASPGGARMAVRPRAEPGDEGEGRTQEMVTPRSSPAFSSSWMRAPVGSNCFTSLALSFAECVFPESTSLSSSLRLRFAAACGHTGRGCRPNFRGRGRRNTPPRRLDVVRALIGFGLTCRPPVKPCDSPAVLIVSELVIAQCHSVS